MIIGIVITSFIISIKNSLCRAFCFLFGHTVAGYKIQLKNTSGSCCHTEIPVEFAPFGIITKCLMCDKIIGIDGMKITRLI